MEKMTLTKKYAHIWRKYLQWGKRNKKELTFAEQTVLAVYMLARLWYKNECTFVRRSPFGDCREYNTATSAANWLYVYRPEIRDILCRATLSPGCYEKLLEEIIWILLNKESLENDSQKPARPARGDVFPCTGPFNRSIMAEMFI